MENLIPQKVGFDAFDFTNCGVKITPIFIFGDFGFQPGKVLYRVRLWQRVVPMRKMDQAFILCFDTRMLKCKSQKYTPMGIQKLPPYFSEIASDLKTEFCIYI